jgi:hypothetical protein
VAEGAAQDELLDLFTYLVSGGNPKDKAFKSSPVAPQL